MELYASSSPIPEGMSAASRRSIPRSDVVPMDAVKQQLESIGRLVTIKRAVTWRKR